MNRKVKTNFTLKLVTTFKSLIGMAKKIYNKISFFLYGGKSLNINY